MNQTTKVAVALIVAAGISTMVYALPEQRAMAHRLNSDPSDLIPDDFPFGPNTPSASKSDPPANSADPPPPGAGPPFGPNCVGCISTQNLANGAVTTPKIAPGAVSTSTTTVGSPFTIVSPGQIRGATALCPPGTVVTGGGHSGSFVLIYAFNHRTNATGNNGWDVFALNPSTSPGSARFQAEAECATIHP